MTNIKKIAEILTAYRPILLKETPKQSAVMVILIESIPNHLEILLTKRAATLPTYAGQYSFPGGIREAQDETLYQTAKREVEEELAVTETHYQLVGQLDDFYARDGHLVRPFVVKAAKHDFKNTLSLSEAEIERIYYLPFEQLKDFKEDPLLHAITRRRPSYSYHNEEGVFVWGLTAAILIHLWQVTSIPMDPNSHAY